MTKLVPCSYQKSPLNIPQLAKEPAPSCTPERIQVQCLDKKGSKFCICQLLSFHFSILVICLFSKNVSFKKVIESISPKTTQKSVGVHPGGAGWKLATQPHRQPSCASRNKNPQLMTSRQIMVRSKGPTKNSGAN